MQKSRLKSGKIKPTINRDIFWAGILFILIFASTVGFTSFLIQKDLSEKEFYGLIQNYTKELSSLMKKIEEEANVKYKGYTQRSIVTTKLNTFLSEKKIFDSIEIYDDKGNLIQSQRYLRGTSYSGGFYADPTLEPGQKRVQTLGRIPIEAKIPIEPGKFGTAILHISEGVLEKETLDLRMSLIRRILVGNGVMLILVIALLFYVIYILRKAKAMEAEALYQDHLSSMGLLTSGIAHEIKNPLNSIQMNLQLMEEELVEIQDSSKVISDILPIRKEIRRLERLVNDILLFAKPLMPKLEMVNIFSLIEEVKRLLAEEASSSGVTINIEGDKEVELFNMDEGMIRITLMNIVLNAIQACTNGGIVKIAIKKNGNLKISVSDTGQGIPSESLDKLFDVFFSTKKGGTGLGLPIANRIVEAHGGTISVDSINGVGSTFIISLPIDT